MHIDAIFDMLLIKGFEVLGDEKGEIMATFKCHYKFKGQSNSMLKHLYLRWGAKGRNLQKGML